MEADCCEEHDKRLTVLELRAEFQGQAMKWGLAAATLIVSVSAIIVAVAK